MKADPNLERLLRAVFGRLQKTAPADHDYKQWEFVFHMTDWRHNFLELADLYENPKAFDKASASRIVAGFLYHAIPHLKAAGRLLLDEIPDAFEGWTPTALKPRVAT